MKGHFRASIVETGELQAVRSQTVVMPWLGWHYGRMKISKLVDEGTEVKIGDFLIELDNSSLVKYIREKEDELILGQVELKRLQTKYHNAVQQIKSRISTAKASYVLQTIQSEKAKFQSRMQQKISQLQLEKAKIEYDRVLRSVDHKKHLLEHEIRIHKLKIAKLHNEIVDAKKALSRTRVVSPANGIIEYKRVYRRKRKIRVGDEFWYGTPLLGIPDLSRMNAVTTVNERDISRIFYGQSVVVRMDAFPKIELKGKIVNISRLCRLKDKSTEKVFDVVVLLEPNQGLLKPGMSVSCEIILAEYDNAVYVRNNCIFKRGAKYFVRIFEGSELKQYEVKIRHRNNQFTVISGRIRAGQICLINEGKTSINAVQRKSEIIG